MWEDELFDEIQKGDDVYYENEQGQTCKGTAMLIGPAGWVLKIANGSKVVNEGYNYLGPVSYTHLTLPTTSTV